ncbi:MAG: DNA repair protein RecO [Microbacteriaceae bacterium]|nr:DNA repair protein RecO [Microbacteriaceae bacterium]
MVLIRDEAIVLRAQKLGEADRIITLLTRNNGKRRAVAKGVRRTSSKFGARLEPGVVVDVQLYEGRNLDTVQQAEGLAFYGAEIANDYPSYTAASAMIETADRLTESIGSAEQYLLLVGGLRALAKGLHSAPMILDSYLLRALAFAGWAPSLDRCAITGKLGEHTAFVIESGGLVSDEVAPPGSMRLDSEILGHLRALLAGDWDTVETSSSSAKSRSTGIIAAYVQWHLDRGLRSLTHVERNISTEQKVGAF